MNLASRPHRAPLLAAVVGVAAALAALILASVAASGMIGTTSWQHVTAARTSGETKVLVDLWLRGQDAVYLERQGSDVLSDRRCIAGTLTEWWPTGRTVREIADRQRCFELATDPLLGFVRVAEGPDFVAAGEPEDGGATGAVFEARATGSHLQRVVVDPSRRLPLRAEFQNGEVSTWEYLAATIDSPPPPPRGPERTETYTDLTPAAAAPALGLSAVPMTVAGRPLLALFRYDSGAPGPADSGPPRVTSTYAVWGEASDLEGTGQIQLVVTDYPPPPDELGIEELGGGAVILRVEEGGRQVLISAPDRATLELAIRALRPGLELPEPSG